MAYDVKALRTSLAAWLRWYAPSEKEREAAPPECRLFLEAMSRASGATTIARIALEIENLNKEEKDVG